MKTTPDVSALF